MKTSVNILLTIGLFFLSSGCGQSIGGNVNDNSPYSQAQNSDSTSNAATSGLIVAEQILSDVEYTPAISTTQVTCPQTTDCAGNIRTVSYNSCSLDNYLYNGSSQFSYDSNATCITDKTGVPTSGYLNKTIIGSLDVTESSGFKTTYSTSAMTTFLGDTISGGSTITFAASSRTLNILGIHRIRKNNSGNVIYNHTMTTTSPLQVSGLLANSNRLISSGTINLYHNLARYTAVIEFQNTKWTSVNCCHPMQGKITTTTNVTSSSQKNEVIVLDFSQNGGVCGIAKASITSEGQTTDSFVNLGPCSQ